MLRPTLISTILALTSCFGLEAAHSEEAKASIEVSGYADFYYQNHSAGALTAGARAFGKKAGLLTLNTAELTLKGSKGPAAIRLDIAAGDTVEDLSPTTTPQDQLRNMLQAYVTYSGEELGGWSINAGKFYTHLGYELTRAKDNWLYTRGLLFAFGIPLWHQGVSASGPIIPGKLTGGVYALNGWDGRTAAELNRSVTLGANLSYTAIANTTLTYNYIGGPEQADPASMREVHELIAAYQTDAFGVALDAIVGREGGAVAGRWHSAALSGRYSLIERLDLVGRYEFFDDRDNGFAVNGALAAAGEKRLYQSMTLGLNRKLAGDLELRFEWRRDTANESASAFKDKDGRNADSQTTYNLAMLLSF